MGKTKEALAEEYAKELYKASGGDWSQGIQRRAYLAGWNECEKQANETFDHSTVEKRTFFKETGTHDYWYPETEFQKLQAENEQLKAAMKELLGCVMALNQEIPTNFAQGLIHKNAYLVTKINKGE